MSHERAALAQRHLAASQAAASQAMAASAKAFRRAAAAHERAALRHERAAAVGSGDKDEHERRAALHRAAQARDAQRADRVESLVPDERRHEQDGKDVDTVTAKRLPLASSNIALRLSSQLVRSSGLTASPPCTDPCLRGRRAQVPRIVTLMCLDRLIPSYAIRSPG